MKETRSNLIDSIKASCKEPCEQQKQEMEFCLELGADWKKENQAVDLPACGKLQSTKATVLIPLPLSWKEEQVVLW